MGTTINITLDHNTYCDKFAHSELILLRDGTISNDSVEQFQKIFDEGNRKMSIEAFRRAISECIEASGCSDGKIVYSFTGKIDGKTTFTSAREVSGIRINSQLFALLGGINRCVLQQIEVQENGRGKVVDEKDVFDLKKLDTDNMGTITIRKSKRPIDVVKFLRRVHAAMTNLNPDELVTIEVG